MREETGNDHISVGMHTPSGKYERPIPGTRLFRTKPGNVLCFQHTEEGPNLKRICYTNCLTLQLTFSTLYFMLCHTSNESFGHSSYLLTLI